MILGQRRDLVFLTLACIFVTNAILGEVMGGKLIQVAGFTMSMGVLPWPIVFIATDLTNEYFGVRGVRRLTFITVGLIIYAFVILFASMQFPATSFSPVTNEAYNLVFGQSLWIICGSIVAFAVSQILDVVVFWALRAKTGGKHLWLRSTGSTVFSQLVDTFIVMGIGFYLPGVMSFDKYIETSSTNYVYKFAIAVSMTPIIYAAHFLIDKFVGRSESYKLIEESAVESLSLSKRRAIPKKAADETKSTKKRK